MSAVTKERPADIISPIEDKVLACKTSAEEATKLGRRAYQKPTPENAIMLFIDHQIGLLAGARDFVSLAQLKSNIIV